ncbi:MAG: mucoidy inhibitor MuiA family protein [Bacteroidota bacterium]
MRKLIWALAMLMLPYTARAQEKEQEVASSIERVTVFLDGAQVTRTAEAQVAAGPATLVFSGLTATLDPQSIQLNAEGALTVLAVTHRLDFFQESETPEVVQTLQAQRQVVQDSLKLQNALLEVYNQEEQMLLANRDLGGTETGLDAATLEAAVQFFRTRLADVKREQLATQREIQRLRTRIQAIDNQIRELRSGPRETTSQVLVSVTAQQATRGTFTLSYVTRQAGWTPAYDIRADDLSQPIAVAYKANVYQSSGEDWDTVRLTLSTGNPSLSNIAPELYPWRLGFSQPQAARFQRTRSKQSGNRSRVIAGDYVRSPLTIRGQVLDADTGDGLPGANVVISGTNIGVATDTDGYYFLPNVPSSATQLEVNYVGYEPITSPLRSNRIDFLLAQALYDLDEIVVVESDVQSLPPGEFAELRAQASSVTVDQVVNATTVEFQIAQPYTIPSDGQAKTVAVGAYDIPATYEHYSVPKLDPAAFLTARITGWGAYNLISGEANLFLEGTYVGTSYLDATNTSDTLVVSLGRDPGVVVKRTKQREFSRERLIGNRQTATRGFDIEIRNTKRQNILLVLDDQAPVSTDDDIDIDVDVDKDEATFDEETGRLRWRLRIGPETTETVAFTYSVRYPKNRRVVLE